MSKTILLFGHGAALAKIMHELVARIDSGVVEPVPEFTLDRHRSPVAPATYLSHVDETVTPSYRALYEKTQRVKHVSKHRAYTNKMLNRRK